MMLAFGGLRGFWGNFSAVVILISLFGLVGCHNDGVTSPPPPAAATLTSIEISPVSPSAAAGTSVQLSVIAIFSDNSHRDVTSSSVLSASNTAVAALNGATVKAITPGSVIIS